MKTQTIVILVITLAILFTVFTSKPRMTEKDINKIVNFVVCWPQNSSSVFKNFNSRSLKHVEHARKFFK